MNENEGVRAIDSEYCLLCGSKGAILYSGLKDRLFGAPGNWKLMRCLKCQLIWLNPQPIPEDVGILYAKYFTHEKLDASKEAVAGFRNSVKASILRTSFGYQMQGSNSLLGSILSWIGPLKEIVSGCVLYLGPIKEGRLLDVGCGNGRFMDQMRQLGWEVTGVEPDKEAVLVALERYGLEVFQGSLEEAEFPDCHFDAITMNHVIEHVPNPILLLKECRRVLRPGGRLIIATPNIKSLGFHVFGEDWRGLEVPRHLFLFAPPSLRACAEVAGLDVQELWTTAKDARWMWAASTIIRRKGMLPGGSLERLSLRLRLLGLAFQAIEHGLCRRWEAGEEVVLMAGRYEEYGRRLDSETLSSGQ